MSTILIAGATKGIGYAMAAQSHARGDTVITFNRSPAPSLAAIGVTTHDGVDLTNIPAVEAVAKKLADGSIDRVIVNAGVMISDSFESFDIEALRLQYEINALAPVSLIRAIAPALSTGAKIALISTRVGSIGDNRAGNDFGYRMSKAALNMAGVNLAHALAPRGIRVFLLHPGYVRTALTGGQGLIDADQSASALLALIDRLGTRDTGTFWHAIEGVRLPW